ncbi:MAG TPA: hypothetical protein PKZ97_20040 [Azospirillaceae bacterium]|nr:hypothetical protein [Azospirillaceae bacterium]
MASSRVHPAVARPCGSQDVCPPPDSASLAACEAAACSCRPMVERAYRELVDHGQPADHAIDAAMVVLRWHHPEVPPPEAAEIVQRWVAAEPMH